MIETQTTTTDNYASIVFLLSIYQMTLEWSTNKSTWTSKMKVSWTCTQYDQLVFNLANVFSTKLASNNLTF